MKSDVEAIIAAKGYGNTSEFFRDLVRNYLRDQQERRLEESLIEALESPATPLTHEDFEEIKRRGLVRLKNRQKSNAA